VEAGECPEAALVRELYEELGILVASTALRPLTFATHRYKAFHLLMPTYVCTEWQGQPRGAEGQQVAWVSAEELAEEGRYEMPPADLPLLPAVFEAMQQQRQRQASQEGAAA
jgi:8-oxo-dGTP diphosphatase